MASRSERGFAAMAAEQQREIARKGGRTAHERGTAHEFDHEEAVEAGRRGGQAVSRDRQHMAEIGRKGGKASHHRDAAFYHEAAAHHHRQAARHHEAGDQEEGERHAEMARGHSEQAHDHSSRSGRGFASMDPEEQREIARMGGRASHGSRSNQREDREVPAEANRVRSRESSRPANEDLEDSPTAGEQNGGEGFASLDPERRREIARKGGTAAHEDRGADQQEGVDDEDEERGQRAASSEQHPEAGRPSSRRR